MPIINLTKYGKNLVLKEKFGEKFYNSKNYTSILITLIIFLFCFFFFKYRLKASISFSINLFQLQFHGYTGRGDRHIIALDDISISSCQTGKLIFNKS